MEGAGMVGAWQFRGRTSVIPAGHSWPASIRVPPPPGCAVSVGGRRRIASANTCVLIGYLGDRGKRKRPIVGAMTMDCAEIPDQVQQKKREYLLDTRLCPSAFSGRHVPL